MINDLVNKSYISYKMTHSYTNWQLYFSSLELMYRETVMHPKCEYF